MSWRRSTSATSRRGCLVSSEKTVFTHLVNLGRYALTISQCVLPFVFRLHDKQKWAFFVDDKTIFSAHFPA